MDIADLYKKVWTTARELSKIEDQDETRSYYDNQEDRENKHILRMMEMFKDNFSGEVDKENGQE